MKLKVLISACAISLLSSVAAGVQAAYPERPIRVIVPFAPGGPADNVARVLGMAVSESLGQPIVVENRPGAGGVIGAAEVARATPDGYTLGVSNADSLITGPILVPTANYDAAKDFDLISHIALGRQAFVVNPNVPVNTLPELIELAKKEPGSINFGSFGPGSRPELLFGEIGENAGVEWMGIPYKGMSLVMQDLLAGRLQVALVPTSLAADFGAKGMVRPIVVLGDERDELFLPDVTTSKEQGVHYPIMETHMWNMLYGPKGMPEEVTRVWTETIQKVLATPEFKEKIEGSGQYVMPGHFGEKLYSDFVQEQELIRGLVLRSLEGAQKEPQKQ